MSKASKGMNPPKVVFSTEQQIQKLKRSCAGKKGSITKRIADLERLVSEGGSRTKINYLSNALKDVHNATQTLFQEMSSLMEEPDNDWMEEIDIRVDICTSEVEEYLEARKDDTPSSSSLTQSWVIKHSAQKDTGNNTVDLQSQPESAVSSDGVTEHLGLPDNLTGDMNLQSIGTSGFQPSSDSKVGNLGIQAERNHAVYSQSSSNTDHDTVGLMASATSRKGVDPVTSTTTWSMDNYSHLFRSSKADFNAQAIPEQLSTAESLSGGIYSMLPGYASTKSKLCSNPIGGSDRYVEAERTAVPYVGRHQSTHQTPGTYLSSLPGLGNTHGNSTNKPAPTLAHQMCSTVSASDYYGVQRNVSGGNGDYQQFTRASTMIPLLASIQNQLPNQPSKAHYISPQGHASEPTCVHQQISTNTGMLLNPASTLNQQGYPTAATNSTVITDNSRSSAPRQQQLFKNNVDSWIDDLHDNRTTAVAQGLSPDITMAWLIQQTLPRVKIPVFDGRPQSWVEFITKFRDLVHNQPYLDDNQRSIYLLQHLSGEAKRSVQGFADDVHGYIRSLKRLKFMFGQRSRIAQATLSKVTRGKQIQDDDHNGLVDFFYTISDCLVTLRMLNYASDLYSYDILHQAVRRLPTRLHNRWAEFCLTIRNRNDEPNLIHLESWVQQRVLAQKDAYLPRNDSRQKQKYLKDESRRDGELKVGDKLFGATQTNQVKCLLCQGEHRIWKCEEFKKLPVAKKFEEVKRRKLCFNCLTTGHFPSKCSSRHKCFVKGCGAKHHTTLHDHFVGKKDSQDVGDRTNLVDKTKSAENNFSGMVGSSQRVYLQVVPVQLIAPDEKIFSTYALLDSGSQSTLLRDDVAKKMKLKGKKRNLNITTIKDKAEKVVVQEVSLRISSRDGTERIKVESAFVVPSNKFNMPSQPLPSDYHDTDVYTHLDGIQLDAVEAKDITILLGANVPELMVPLEVRRGTNYQPLALKTKLGWTLFGTSVSDSIQHVSCNLIHASEDDEKMHKLLQRFWVQEHYATERDVGMSIEDKNAEQKLQSATSVVDGKYEVPMLWKADETILPNNLSQARRRFDFLQKRLRADPELFQKYQVNISQYLEKGYARVMTKDEERKISKRTWYLPHHPVFNPNKPGKLRVVFDAAARYDGKSLNESLITGPDLLNNLVGILLRFRTDPVAIAADIEAMFHQVRVNSQDADSLRFFWKDNIHSNDDPKTLQMLVHIFGAKDSPSCANFAIKCTARENHQHFDALTHESALRAFYADDLLKSVKTEETACKLAKELIDMMRCGGFRLTKFISNRKAVMDALPNTEVSPNVEFDLDKENFERTLGVCWEINQDVFTFQANIKDAPFTKRGILRTISSIFDPLGFLGPYIVKAKIFIQELWRQEYGWDDEINAEYSKYWTSWLEGAKNIKKFRLNRCYNINNQSCDVELHIFGDASELAYGAAAYLRFTSKDGIHTSILVMSKCKLAPIKTVTLPRLELNAAVIAVRLYRTLIRELDIPIEMSYFWTDSTLTLQYIKNESKRFKTYVANRVTEILEVTQRDQWKYVPGEKNPADLVTRGVSDPASLVKADKFGRCWISGPDFLIGKECNQPQQPLLQSLEPTDIEIRQKRVLMSICRVPQRLIEVERFSKWQRLRRSMAWILRFLHNCKESSTEKIVNEHLSFDELSTAEKLVIKDVQQEAFASEISLLKNGKEVPSSNKLSSLCPFLDEKGIIRVGGRLMHARISSEAKHQYILPKKHHVSMLIIRHEHERNGHIGREHVLANLRQFCWILNARAAIKGVIYGCFPCKRKRARLVQPFMADLPEGRLAYGEPPFSNCGVDLFGPLYVKQGRKRLKRWGVIFTCLTVRCVHLEVVENADTDSFISCLRRFSNRRGKPKTMYSDCGTNFKGASKELKELIASLNQAEIGNFVAENGIDWRFNPPGAPHMGGVWERLVRSVKEVMTGIMQDKVLTDWQLATLLTEVEGILNSRPLTHSSEDIDDFEALTPNHALVGHHANWQSIGEFSERMNYRKRWKQVQSLACYFWKRWRREYLPILTTRTSGRIKLPNYAVGDLVLYADTDVSRGKWPLARITKVMPGEDGVVRVAEIRTKNGVYVRPVVKLYKLEETETPQGEGNVGDRNTENTSSESLQGGDV